MREFIYFLHLPPPPWQDIETSAKHVIISWRLCTRLSCLKTCASLLKFRQFGRLRFARRENERACDCLCVYDAVATFLSRKLRENSIPSASSALAGKCERLDVKFLGVWQQKFKSGSTKKVAVWKFAFWRHEPRQHLCFCFGHPLSFPKQRPEKWFEKLLKIRWISRWARLFCVGAQTIVPLLLWRTRQKKTAREKRYSKSANWYLVCVFIFSVTRINQSLSESTSSARFKWANTPK